MSDEPRNTYEGLFLFPQAATGDLKSAREHVEELLGRAGAEIVSLKKWEERRLAYEIKGNKRGVYFLVYFRAPGAGLAGLERDCNLSEQLLRAMVTRADHITDEVIQSAEGREQLADEIRLRGEQGPAETASRVRVEQKSEAEEAPDAAVATAEPESPPAGEDAESPEEA